MRVLFWSEHFHPEISGAAVASARLLRALHTQHEMEVVADIPAGLSEAPASYHGLRVHRFPLREQHRGMDIEKLAATRGNLLRAIRGFSPDLIHGACGAVSLYFLLEAKRACRLPTLVTVHRFWDAAFLADDAVLGKALRAADGVVCVSHALRDHLCSIVPEVSDRCRVIPNLIDIPGDDIAPLPWEPPVLLCAGRLAVEKNIALALEAVRRLRLEHTDVRLVMAGDGPERAALQSRASELGVADSVTFLGWVDPEAMPALIRKSTILLMPSDTEGLPLAALEAGAAGRPVVASRVGGLPEIVKDGRTGLLVEAGNVAAFVQALSLLLQDRSLAERMGQSARQHIALAYSSERCLAAYETLYRDLCLGKVAHAGS